MTADKKNKRAFADKVPSVDRAGPRFSGPSAPCRGADGRDDGGDDAKDIVAQEPGSPAP